MVSNASEPPGRPDGTAYAPLDANAWVRARAATADVVEALRRHHGWRYLAAEQVKNSYRRTVLGPWWLTAQQAVYVSGLGFVFSQLFHQNLKTFLPYVAVGFLSYVLLLGLLRNGANVFVGQAGLIMSTRQPLTSIVLRSVMVELIQFGHNAVISVVFFAVGYVRPTPWLLLAPAALVVMLVNGILVGLWLGPVVARFRDVSPAIDSVLQVIIFFTPIFYKTSDLSGLQATLIEWNPFTPFIDFFRSCVLGSGPTAFTLVGVVVFSLLNLVLALVVFTQARSRVPYWVS
ncbi:MAG: rfbD [Frankiales bacterium]|nr:rfbD [Frankiales bacterium]